MAVRYSYLYPKGLDPLPIPPRYPDRRIQQLKMPITLPFRLRHPSLESILLVLDTLFDHPLDVFQVGRHIRSPFPMTLGTAGQAFVALRADTAV